MAELTCPECGKEFDSEKELKIHKGKVHSEGKRRLTIPLSKVKHGVSRTKRAQKAMKFLKDQVSRHMNVRKEFIKISNEVNQKVWSRGIQKPPSKLKILVEMEDGQARVRLA